VGFNVGIIDGRLHVQVATRRPIGLGFPDFTLVAPSGERIVGADSLMLYTDDNMNLLEMPNGVRTATILMVEYIFDVNVDNLSNYTLVFSIELPRR